MVTSLETIEHIQNPWAFLSGLNDLVKPGGHLMAVSQICCNFMQPQSTNSALDIGLREPIGPDYSKFSTLPVSGGEYPLIWFNKHIANSLLFSQINLISLPFGGKKELLLVQAISGTQEGP